MRGGGGGGGGGAYYGACEEVQEAEGSSLFFWANFRTRKIFAIGGEFSLL